MGGGSGCCGNTPQIPALMEQHLMSCLFAYTLNKPICFIYALYIICTSYLLQKYFPLLEIIKTQTELFLQFQVYFNPITRHMAHTVLPFRWMVQKKNQNHSFLSVHCYLSLGYTQRCGTSILLGKNTWHFCFARTEALRFSW